MQLNWDQILLPLLVLMIMLSTSMTTNAMNPAEKLQLELLFPFALIAPELLKVAYQVLFSIDS